VAAHLAVEHGAGADARYARAAQRQGVRPRAAKLRCCRRSESHSPVKIGSAARSSCRLSGSGHHSEVLGSRTSDLRTKVGNGIFGFSTTFSVRDLQNTRA
jgi:hypothetical protein